MEATRSPMTGASAQPAREAVLPKRGWKRAIPAVVLLALVTAAAFWPVVSGARSFFHLDLRYEHLPVWQVTQEALREGRSPFWIDGEYCGHPLLFHQEAPIFYPLTAPLLLSGAPVQRLADAFSLLHFWIAGAAAFLLLLELGADRTSGLFGAIAWMLSARLVQSAIWPNAVAISALLPLLFVGLLRIARGLRRSGVVLSAIVGGLAILASRPHVLVAAAPLAIAFTLWAFWPVRRSKRAWADLALALAAAVALGAPALLPSAALYPEMSRAGGLSSSDRDFGHIAPGEDLDLVFLPVDGLPRWPEAAAYPGVLAGLLFLAGIALSLRKVPAFPRGLFLALLAGGLIGLAFAFGEAGPYRLFARLPLLRGFRAPARYLLSWSLALALGSALVLAWLLPRLRRSAAAGGVAILLLAGDLIAHARRAAPTAPSGLDAVEPAVVRILRERLGRDEVGFPRRFRSLAEKIPLQFIPDDLKPAVIRRYDPLIFALGMRFGLESVDGGGPGLMRTERLLTRPTPRGNALAGAGCLVVSGPKLPGLPVPELVVETVPALPRALLVPAAIAVPPERAVAAVLSPAIDPRRVAIVEDAEELEAVKPGEPAGRVRLIARSPGRVALETNAPSARILVLFDSWEKGWRATIDGRAVDVFPADAAFRGVRVAAGSHRVLFEYEPPGLRAGLGLFAAGVLVLVLFCLRAKPAAARLASPARTETAAV